MQSAIRSEVNMPESTTHVLLGAGGSVANPLARVNRTILETVEMLYQYEIPYVFDSSKFERRFAFSPVPYVRGIEETARLCPSDSGISRGSR